MSDPRPKKQREPVCDRCGLTRVCHHGANLSDGQFVGVYLPICPTAVFYANGYDAGGNPLKDKA